MSYIIQGTTYTDPEFTFYDMDLNDIKNIYSYKINSYFATEELGNKYYNETPTTPAYTWEEARDIVCWKSSDKGTFSVLPLFIFLTIKTKNWTQKIEDINSVIANYENEFNSLVETQNIEDYPGIRLYVEKPEEETPEGEEEVPRTFLEIFIDYWKSDCYGFVSLPNKNIEVASKEFTEAEKERQRKVQSFLKDNSSSYAVDENGNIYNKKTKRYILGGGSK